ncbi:hypothetical protein L484_002977 [Morus notabilis]|uniref:Uncharacterized protein n=1 Tax=Morus notabilis TaxID=981085 RepID=W9SDS8_9ROSA|nr:hypothetical protein L484_002977 [Morus notabilis]
MGCYWVFLIWSNPSLPEVTRQVTGLWAYEDVAVQNFPNPHSVARPNFSAQLELTRPNYTSTCLRN